MADDIYDACIDLNEAQLSAGGYDTYRSPPVGFPSAPSIDGEPIRDAALPPLVENLRGFFKTLTRHFNFTFKDYVKGRDEFDALFFRGGAGGTEFRALLQNFAADVFPQMFEFVDARQFFQNVNIQKLVEWFWWAVNQGPGKDGDFEVVLVDGLEAGQDIIQQYIKNKVLENPEYFYPLVPPGPTEDPTPPEAVILLGRADGAYSGIVPRPALPTVPVQLCDNLQGDNPDGNNQTCVLPYIGDVAGQHQGYPNVQADDVIQIVASPDPAYAFMATGAEIMDDPINTVKLWYGAAVNIPVGWDVVTEAEDRFVVGVGNFADFDGHGTSNQVVGNFSPINMTHVHPATGTVETIGLDDRVTDIDFAHHIPPFLALYWIRRVS